MAALEDQKNVTLETKLSLGSNITVATQVSVFNESPALALLESKLLNRRKRAKPYTYRRPAYLQYIEYV